MISLASKDIAVESKKVVEWILSDSVISHEETARMSGFDSSYCSFGSLKIMTGLCCSSGDISQSIAKFEQFVVRYLVGFI